MGQDMPGNRVKLVCLITLFEKSFECVLLGIAAG